MAEEVRTTVSGRSRIPLIRFVASRYPRLAGDAVAGLVGAVVLIANIVSFATLIFPGELVTGVPTAIWAMLIGSCLAGIWISLTTSLPPLSTGMDSPTGAVLILLSATIGAAAAAHGLSPKVTVDTVMMVFTVATLVTGVLFYALGALRWAPYFRFVPYFVVGGFLAATGWFLISGGVRMTTGRTLGPEIFSSGWSIAEIARLGCAVATLAILLTLRYLVKSVMAIPAALIAMWATGALALQWLGLAQARDGWYFPSIGSLEMWSPLAIAGKPAVHWPTVVAFVPEIAAVTLVALLSLVTKVSSMEVVRQASGNLDREFRSHGIANMLIAPAGGIISGMQTGTSRLLEQAGGTSRLGGVFCALAIGLVGVANFNLAGMIPIPIIAGLVFYLGYTFLMDALARPFLQRAWLDLFPAIVIAIVCVKYGYLFGVLMGLVGACLLFAITYARVDVVRRSVTRDKFASNVDRSPEASAHLREAGDAIRLYWLSGYIFFGSSEGIFERIRNDIEARPPGRVQFVILDFGMVSGADSSAVVSLIKLRNYCDRHRVTLVYCALSPVNHATLQKGGFFGGKSRHRAFPDINTALAWCEDQLLASAAPDAGPSGFEQWLQKQLGDGVPAADLMAYLERRDIEDTQVLYRRGDAADTVDLVATGALSVELTGPENETARQRRIATHTVIGEMGFFRKSRRSATVSTEGPATIFTLTRANFERMERERPDLAIAFYNFIICILSDRIEFSNREVAALSA